MVGSACCSCILSSHRVIQDDSGTSAEKLKGPPVETLKAVLGAALEKAGGEVDRVRQDSA